MSAFCGLRRRLRHVPNFHPLGENWQHIVNAAPPPGVTTPAHPAQHMADAGSPRPHGCLCKTAVALWMPLLLGLFSTQAAAVEHLDLATAYRLAATQDPGITVARARLEADTAGVDIAYSRLLPAVGFTASLGRSRTETEYPGSLRPGVTNDYESRNLALTARQPLYRPVDRAGLAKAEEQAGASAHVLRLVQADLLKRVARAYAQVLTAQAQRDVASNEVERLGTVLRQAERGFTAGAATRTDIEDARARRDIAAAALVRAEGELVRAREALQIVIGAATAPQTLRPFVTVEPLAQHVLALPLERWQEQALTRNPEVMALRAHVRAAEEEVRRQRAQHLPTLDLVASRRHSRNDAETTIGQQYDTTGIALQFNLPLYAGGGIDASVRAALAAKSEAEGRLDARRRELRQTITQGYHGVRYGLAQWQALAQAERSAEQALIGARKGLEAGTRNTVDVLNAEQDLARTRASRIDIAYQTLVALIEVLTAAEEGVDAVLERLQ